MTYSLYTGLKAAAFGASALVALTGTGRADQVIADDLIVQGSLCVGQDCVNGESFGFDTIRLKENNTRIKFQDTSNSASFPSVDWQLTANDSTNGGANKFSIDDIDNSRTPFTVTAGARNNSIFVNNTGRVGFGTATPSVDLHVVNGNSPTLRLDQDGSSGFTPQVWDVAGNEAGFFVRDVTNGSQLPLRIIPGADSNAIVIGANNDVGMGTDTTPDENLHLRGSGSVAIRLESTDAPYPIRLNLNPTFDVFRITFDGSGRPTQFQLDEDGNVIIPGTITTTGSCATPCDGVFGEDYELLPIEQNAAFMWQNGHLPSVGATPESGQYELSSKVLSMLTELEKAHIYIEQLHSRITDLEKKADSKG